MTKLKDLTRYLVYSYETYTREKFSDELKLHKLMYFAQRKSLALTGEPLFKEPFDGGILPELSFFFSDNYLPYDESETSLTKTQQHIIDTIVGKYGKYASWYLAEVSNPHL